MKSETSSAVEISLIDPRNTVFDFGNGDLSAFNWEGEITYQNMVDAGLFNEGEWTWTKMPVNVIIGNSVSCIGDSAFDCCSGLTSIAIPDSVASIGSLAFSGCIGLTIVTIPNSVTSIEEHAFEYCSGLTSIIVKGKTQSEAEALLADANVPAGCTISTWNDASQEWVNDTVETKATGVSIRYATCSTASNIAAKEAVIADGKGDFVLATGAVVVVKFANGNKNSSPTLNVGGTGAKDIKRYGSTSSLSVGWSNGEAIELIYDGTAWMLVKSVKATSENFGTVKISDSTSGDDSETAVSQKAMSTALRDQVEPL